MLQLPLGARVQVMPLLRRLFTVVNRRPWLLPAISFAAGWVGFLLVRRGEEVARVIALLALCGWFWLLLEPWIRRRLEKRRKRVGNFVVNFVSQSLQQELLFFSLPLLIGATQLVTNTIDVIETGGTIKSIGEAGVKAVGGLADNLATDFARAVEVDDLDERID